MAHCCVGGAARSRGESGGCVSRCCCHLGPARPYGGRWPAQAVHTGVVRSDPWRPARAAGAVLRGNGLGELSVPGRGARAFSGVHSAGMKAQTGAAAMSPSQFARSNHRGQAPLRQATHRQKTLIRGEQCANRAIQGGRRTGAKSLSPHRPPERHPRSPPPRTATRRRVAAILDPLGMPSPSLPPAPGHPSPRLAWPAPARGL
jgi:hypothetical protein